MFVAKLLSPKNAYFFCQNIKSWCFWLFLLFFLLGVIDGFWLAPTDYQQGDVYRIMFLHVPCAVLSLGIYLFMALVTIVFFIWKINIADRVAKICAKQGALFTFFTLVTGSLWGKPTWGTYWIWDARLTSELILLFIYLSIIAIRSAIPNKKISVQACGVVTLMGLINLPIVHYSVQWWQTLHQGPTLLKWGIPSISWLMLRPLLLMFIAGIFYMVWIICVALSKEILQDKQNCAWTNALNKS